MREDTETISDKDWPHFLVDEAVKLADSARRLREATGNRRGAGWRLVNANITLIEQAAIGLHWLGCSASQLNAESLRL